MRKHLPKAPDNWPLAAEVAALAWLSAAAIIRLTDRPTIYLDGRKARWGWLCRTSGNSKAWAKAIHPDDAVQIAKFRKRAVRAPGRNLIAAKSSGLPFPEFPNVGRWLFYRCRKSANLLGRKIVAVNRPTIIGGVLHNLQFYERSQIEELNRITAQDFGRYTDIDGKSWLTIARAGQERGFSRDQLRALVRTGNLRIKKFRVISFSNQGPFRRTVTHVPEEDLPLSIRHSWARRRNPERTVVDGRGMVCTRLAVKLAKRTSSALYRGGIFRIQRPLPGQRREYVFFDEEQCRRKGDVGRAIPPLAPFSDENGTNWYPTPLVRQLTGWSTTTLNQISNGKTGGGFAFVRCRPFPNPRRGGHPHIQTFRKEDVSELARMKGRPDPFAGGTKREGLRRRCFELYNAGYPLAQIHAIVLQEFAESRERRIVPKHYRHVLDLVKSHAKAFGLAMRVRRITN